tara:strand:+ start:475 stop:1680 length:1206 start_codon:yes stop_codon:yes gene_type:complete
MFLFRLSLALIILVPKLILPTSISGQTEDIRKEILESQQRLEDIRVERERLQKEMTNLEGRVRNVSSELANIEKQISVSRSVLGEIEFQVNTVAKEIENTSRDLLLTREQLQVGTAVLNRRLRDIYKRGSLHTVRVILGSSSFADLLTRYRYLHLIASYDQQLLERVKKLESDILIKKNDFQNHMSDIGRLRQVNLAEVVSLRSVERRHRISLKEYRSVERKTGSRLEELENDEVRLALLITDLEARRIEIERRNNSSNIATISSEDMGTLDWPVDGDLAYLFGLTERPNGTVLKWNGIGIQAPTGTPVRAVLAGTVVLAGPFEGYGPTVVISHGEGFYTLYLYLEDIGVIQGQRINSAQVIGTVGGSDTPEGSHIEFQVRTPVDGGSPQATDPIQWLRPR